MTMNLEHIKMMRKMKVSIECFTDRKRHLVCVPYSIENLHKMADDLNIGRHWFHSVYGLDHYDIPKRRITEIEARCTIVTPKDIVKIIRGTYDRTNNYSRDDL
jgi:hypothetical protein